jgi:DNA-directed RNA polymerase sigma subunit (sigma70/sigma32)
MSTSLVDACRRLVEAFIGLTAERARQIEVGALNKLRSALAQPAQAWR